MRSSSAGFTLIETLVAITVLVVAVAAPLTLAAQSLFAAYYAKDQVTASHLAQEAIELVRIKRDENLMKILTNNNPGTNAWLDNIISTGSERTFAIDVENATQLGAAVYPCASVNDACARLYYNGKVYVHSGGTPTRFYRIIHIKKKANEPNEIELISEVSWQTGSFSRRTFTIKEDIYNWLPKN